MAEIVANGAEVAMDLYNRIPGTDEINVLLGGITKGDSQVTMWQYDMASTALDNFSGGVIVPTLNTSGMGAHIRQNNLNAQPDFNQTNSALYSYIANKPTTLSGYGITNAYPLSGNPSSFLTTTGSAASLTSFPTLNQNTTGNSATATKLATARTINGVSFDGSTNITLPSSLSYSAYGVILTQTGSSAPSATTVQNDFTGTTFTWTRSSAGIYVVTASSAVFTSGKTVLLQSNPQSVLVNYTAVVNSTTQITVTTSSLALLLTILGATATDGLMTNTLAEIRVYH